MPANRFQVELVVEAKQAVLCVSGMVDRENDHDLEDAIDELMEQDVPRFVVDMRRVRFVASMCFGVLIVKGQAAMEQNRTLVAIFNKHLAHLARSIGVEQVVTIEEA